MAVKKLRRQDLSAILEGCGWAVNVRMGLDRAQRRHFTREVPYPEDAVGTPRSTWCLWVILALLMTLMATAAHYISKYLMGDIRAF